jgi:hypothetical protein
MPNPKNNESQQTFVSRCIPELIDEGKPKDQAIAICYSIYRQQNEMSSTNDVATFTSLLDLEQKKEK